MAAGENAAGGSTAIEMPDGVYLTLCDSVRASAGGQTRAMIMRSRLITRHTGIPTTVLTTDMKPVYPEQRERLTEQGALIDGMRLLNVYEWYRDEKLRDEEPSDEARLLGDRLPELPGVDRTRDEPHPDGTVYYTQYFRDEQQEVARDYRRADGSVYLRVPAGPLADKYPLTPFVLVGHDGQPLHAWPKIGGWHWHWLDWLAGDAERVFVVTDSRFALGRILPRTDPRFYLLHLIHNNHTVGQRRWDSTLSPDYAPLFNRVKQLDGLVTLTERQSQDVAQRFGPTSNLFVVPNPVELPDLPDPMPERERAAFVIVSRLEKQKRLHHAVEAFAKVVKQRPEATLRIYGHGKLERELQAQIDSLGVGDKIRLMGFDPDAKRELLTATGFLMTSTHEGYPLATLESMAFGCPVVSYDIKYGPRDQITDGVDGFVVPAEDMDAVADRCIRMIDSPELVRELSRNALLKAADHDWRRFLRDWRHAFETAVEQRWWRLREASAHLEVHRLLVGRPAGFKMRRAAARLVPGARLRTASGVVGTGDEVDFYATLTVRGDWRKHAMDRRVITLDAVCTETGDVVSLPISDESPDRGVFRLSSRFSLGQVFEGLPPEARSLRLRLRFTANNWSWQTDLHRPGRDRPDLEVSFGPDDVVHVQRR
ncbi:glycosyltransferase [Nocardioides sp. SYSU DS0651]|uniref:glycosyltransferase n=1 Tax=Nocardioides sp. SYSU DS0651 TaxID=3415955 RepID=UPI003F4B7A49